MRELSNVEQFDCARNDLGMWVTRALGIAYDLSYEQVIALLKAELATLEMESVRDSMDQEV